MNRSFPLLLLAASLLAAYWLLAPAGPSALPPDAATQRDGPDAATAGTSAQSGATTADAQRPDVAVRVAADVYWTAEALEEARTAVVENCERNGQLEIPELRDRLKTTRKFLIPLLEHLDAVGVTLRQGGHRVLKRR